MPAESEAAHGRSSKFIAFGSAQLAAARIARGGKDSQG